MFDNTESKKFFKHDAEHIQEILDEAIARQWVSVSERLPEERRDVLVWDSLYENKYTMYWEEGQWFLFGGSAEVNYNITHWKPLPEAPKG